MPNYLDWYAEIRTVDGQIFNHFLERVPDDGDPHQRDQAAFMAEGEVWGQWRQVGLHKHDDETEEEASHRTEAMNLERALDGGRPFVTVFDMEDPDGSPIQISRVHIVSVRFKSRPFKEAPSPK